MLTENVNDNDDDLDQIEKENDINLINNDNVSTLINKDKSSNIVKSESQEEKKAEVIAPKVKTKEEIEEEERQKVKSINKILG